MKTLWLLLMSVGLLPAFARTVALWPLETDASGNLDGRCTVDWHNDLTCNASRYEMVDSDLGWNLPPNPDPACHAYEPLNCRAIQAVPTSSTAPEERRLLHHDSAGPLVFRDKDFTVEGWVKLQDLPARDAWWYVVGCQDNNQSGKNRWQLSFRRRSSENYASSWIIWANGGQDMLLYAHESEAESLKLVGTWIHVAIVHGKASNGNDSWTLFLNGKKVGDTQYEGGWITPSSPETGCFDIGARGSNANGMLATFDYWRISDVKLTADKFLCAGSSGNIMPPSHTVAYWPLDVNAEGVVDGRDAVGDSPLSSGFHDAEYKANTMAPSMDSAFTGNPPNATVALSGGNLGSLQGCRSWGVLQQETVGKKLNCGESFTVEGWIKPRIVDRVSKGSTQEVVSYLFGTRPDSNKGWSLVYRAEGVNSAKFELYAVDQNGRVSVANAKLSGDVDVASWSETWHHVALVYDKTGGGSNYGCWTLYLDGTQAGSYANAFEIAPVTESRSFFIGGRTSTDNQGFQGRLDCFRVCQAVLQPSQFLNARDGATAATDVVALWPLNVENGNYLDLRDVSGQNLHFAKKDDNSRQLVIADAVTDGPVITNPDRSSTFRGCRTMTHGSCRFRNPDAAIDNNRAYLETGSSAVLGAMAGGKEFTFEFYYRRHKPIAEVGDYQEVPLAVANASTSVGIRFFRKSTGFYIYENANGGTLSDTLFAGTSDNDLECDRWYHIALVHSIETVSGSAKSVWRLYVDGKQKGDAAMTSRGTGTAANVIALIGGRRWADANSIIGNMSSVRLSSVALDPSDFLCADPVAPVPTTSAKTVAYWPIDNGSVGLGERLAECGFVASGTIVAQEDQSRGRVPNKSAMPEVTGAARRNEGSVAVGANGVLTAPNVGFGLTFAKPFTLEGWVKMANLKAKNLLAETGMIGSGAGVSLWIDMTGGTPKLGLRMCDDWPATPIAEGLFDADLTSFLGVWTHLAVTYNPFDDVGIWTLHANGKQIATVKNFYRPNGNEAVRCGDFRLGSEGLSVDMWRISAGVLEPSGLLYADPAGLFIVVK